MGDGLTGSWRALPLARLLASRLLCTVALAASAWAADAGDAGDAGDVGREKGPSGSINFSPVVAKFLAPEGPDLNRPFFKWGDHFRIGFFEPNNASVFGAADSYRIGPKGYPGSEIIVRTSPLRPDLPFTERAYEEASKAYLSGASTAPVLKETRFDPYPINDWTGVCFVYQFVQNDLSQKRMVSFVTMTETTQIVVVVSGEEKAFPEVAEIAHQFLNSWFVTTEESMAQPGLN
jgi:hypothetical protein